jgi:hypothetical protein
MTTEEKARKKTWTNVKKGEQAMDKLAKSAKEDKVVFEDGKP